MSKREKRWVSAINFVLCVVAYFNFQYGITMDAGGFITWIRVPPSSLSEWGYYFVDCVALFFFVLAMWLMVKDMLREGK
jgi:hypothetical protein